jgi:two-component system, OmpR family, response regulator CpxR
MPSAILCVDDNEAALRVRKLVLESAGHQVQTAVTAADARELIATQPFDLAIVDYYLDGISGDELAAGLKGYLPDMAVILLSGADGLENLEHVDSFVHKGDGPQALLKEIERLAK